MRARRIRAGASAGAIARARALLVSAALATALGGCVSPAGISPTAAAVDPAAVGAKVAQFDPADWPGEDAWKRLGDEHLAALIDKALADSPTLKVAAARLERARALAEAADAARSPQVNASVESNRQRYSEHGFPPPPFAGTTFSTNNALVNASWALDFFGRNRAALESALGQVRASDAELQAARVVLASQVTRTWFQLARALAQRDVAAATLKQREQLLALVDQRVRAGLDTKIELSQAQAALPDTRRTIESFDEQAALARNMLAALTAQPAEALAGLSPSLPTQDDAHVPAVIPADLLGRRADVVAARWRIESAVQDVSEARAQFYPNVNLNAFVGFSALGLDRWFDIGSRTYGGGPAIRLPIFDAGRLRANLRARSVDADAAVQSYNGAIVDAVREVADQLATLRSLERQVQAQREAQSLTERALDLAIQRYRAGLGNYLTVLSAETAVLVQRAAAVDLAARRVDARVMLVRALGGGYDEAKTTNVAATASVPAPAR